MVFKVVVSDKGSTYQIETEDKNLVGLKIGDDFDGSFLGLDGYNLKITGGSDKNGFAMRSDVPGPRRIRTLVSGGVGYKPHTAGERRRKNAAGKDRGRRQERGQTGRRGRTCSLRPRRDAVLL